MEKKRTKYIFLLSGILLGFFIGVITVWGIQKYKIRFFLSINPLDVIHPKNTSEELKIKKDTMLMQNKPSKYKILTTNSEVSHSPVSVEDNVSSDTMYHVSIDYEDVEVARDELLFVKNIKLKKNETILAEKRLDSLLIDDNSVDKNVLRVEFWKSPINYRGYKLGNNKLVLFGIYEPEKLKLEQEGDNLVMTYKGLSYELQQSDDFIQLGRVKRQNFRN